MDECFFHHEVVDKNEKLQSLSCVSAWKAITEAAKVRKNQNVISLAETVEEGTFPSIKFHKSCRAMFTMKRDLDKIRNDYERYSRRSSGTSSNILPPECIFCKKTKYSKEKRVKTREALRDCQQFRADDTIRKASEIRNDMKMIALSSEELIAKEAKYHASCYRDYTRALYIKDKNVPENLNVCDEAFELVKQKLKELYKNPSVLEFVTISSVYERNLLESSIEKAIAASLKKNLKRKILTNMAGFNFAEMNRRNFMYPETLKLEETIKQLLEVKFELESLLKLNDTDKSLLKCSKVLRDEITNLDNKISWPPKPYELSIDNFSLPHHTDFFLDNLLRGMKTRNDSPRVSRLKMSFGQDLMYAVSQGTFKIPKSILFPYTMKSLTNNTEIINLTNKFGHGISYTLLEEIETEIAFQRMEVDYFDGVVLPRGCKEETSSLYVGDNIDNEEQTLSGE